MPPLVPIKFRKLVKILQHLGFDNTRTQGSHHFFVHPDGRTTTVPFKHQEVQKKLLRKILRDIDCSVEDFDRYRQQF